MFACVSELVHAHLLDNETSIVDGAGWKWYIQRAAAAFPAPSRPMTSILLSIHFFICYYYELYLIFPSNLITLNDYNVI